MPTYISFLNQKPFRAPISATKKWYPGHYLFLANSVISDPTKFDAVLDTHIPAIVAGGGEQPGILWDVLFRDIEISFGVYDWTTIDNYAAECEARGVRWGLKVFFRTYSAGHAIPDYMITDTATYGGGYGTGNSAGGEYIGASGEYNAKIWVTAVANRFTALLQAIAARYNTNPYFALCVVQETAMLAGSGTGGTPADPKTSATLVADYFANLISCMTTAVSSFTQTPLIQTANFPAGTVTGNIWQMTPDLGQQLATAGVGLGIQDRYKRQVSGCAPLLESYDNIEEHATTVPIFCNFSNGGSLTKLCNDATPGDSVYALAVDAASDNLHFFSWHVASLTSSKFTAIKNLLTNNAVETRPNTTRPSGY